MKIGMFGLGEAGSLIAADLVAAGVVVVAYDPADVPTPKYVHRVNVPAAIMNDANVVISVTAGTDAITAMRQALTFIPATALYADFSTHAPSTKQQLAAMALSQGFDFVDIALLGVVPGKGVRTPALAAGEGASRFIDIFAPLGMPVSKVSEQPGDAAQRKLLRSIMMKGLASTIIEALRAAEKLNCVDWLWANISHEISQADEPLLARLVEGTQPHAQRRLHEMQACQMMLQDLNIQPVMTTAIVENLQHIIDAGLPAVAQSKLKQA